MGLDRLFNRRTQKEVDPEVLRKNVEGLFAKYSQPPPSPEAMSLIMSEDKGLGKLLDCLKNVENASTRSWYLCEEDFLRSYRYGITDFSGTRFPAISDMSLTNLDLQGVSFLNHNMECNDFSGSNMTDMECRGTNFDYSILDTAKIDSIRVGEESINLWDRPVMIDIPLWDMKKTLIEPVDNCFDCERWNGKVLEHGKDASEYSRRGILLFQDGIPLGYMKLKGENSFLAIRTVTTTSGEVLLWKGMVYALEEPLRDALYDKSTAYQDEEVWRRVDIENIKNINTQNREAMYPRVGRNNLRFIADPSLYPEMTALVDRIEAGTEPMVDILADV